jgi:hypothetical protein
MIRFITEHLISEAIASPTVASIPFQHYFRLAVDSPLIIREGELLLKL